MPFRSRILSIKNGAILCGCAVMAYGISLAWSFRSDELLSIAKWSIGISVLHDMVWLPITVAVGNLLNHAPSWLRAPVASASGLSVALVAVSLPFIAGYGRKANNASLLPRNYAVGAACYLVLVWVCAAAVGCVLWSRDRAGD